MPDSPQGEGDSQLRSVDPTLDLPIHQSRLLTNEDSLNLHQLLNPRPQLGAEDVEPPHSPRLAPSTRRDSLCQDYSHLFQSPDVRSILIVLLVLDLDGVEVDLAHHRHSHRRHHHDVARRGVRVENGTQEEDYPV